MKMIRLENVIDTRTEKTHSVAIVPENKVRFFIPANEAENSNKE